MQSQQILKLKYLFKSDYLNVLYAHRPVLEQHFQVKCTHLALVLRPTDYKLTGTTTFWDYEETTDSVISGILFSIYNRLMMCQRLRKVFSNQKGNT